MAAILSRRQCVNRNTEVNIIEKVITSDNPLLLSKHLTVKRIYKPLSTNRKVLFHIRNPHLWPQ